MTDTDRRPTPEMITMALDACELYGPDVDTALGGVEPMVDEWESGARVPTLEQIEALAELTDYPVAFFYQLPPPPMVGFMCQRSGRGKGCQRIDTRPAAAVVPLFTDRLF